MTTKNPETHQNPELGKETNGNKKPETSLEKKREGEILRSLGIKKIKIEEAKSRI